MKNKQLLAIVLLWPVITFSQDIWEDPTQPIDDRVDNLVSLMTFQQKISQMNYFETKALPGFGIDITHSFEALHGIYDWRIGNTSTTAFPVSIGLSCTWDTTAIFEMADAISDEGRALNNAGIRKGLMIKSPTINMARDPRWGRTAETYGEDPFLTAELGKAFVKGIQGTHPTYLKAVSTPKHMTVNNEEFRRLTGSSTVDDRSLREYYLPPYKALLIDQEARGVMAAYNEMNEVPCQANRRLLTNILKNEWGHEGYAITDGDGTLFVVNGHSYVGSFPLAVAVSINSGCDIDLSSAFYYKNNLTSAFDNNLVTEERIDVALKRFMKVRFELGEFDPPELVPFTSIPGSVNNCQEHRDLAYSIAQKSIVLLKNENNFLPLDKDLITSIAVIGPFADTAIFGAYAGVQAEVTTALEGIESKAGGNISVSYNKAYDFGDFYFDDEAVTLAQNSDYVILCIGEDIARFSTITPRNGGETYDRSTLDLPDVVMNLTQAVYDVNPNTVVVLFNQEPWAINWINDSIPAIVESWFAGEEQGAAIADVLFGDYNPSGKLSTTWYKSHTELPSMEDYNVRNNRTYMYFTGEPLYPFGYGLSYTSYEYSNLTVSGTSLMPDESVVISADITNTGEVAGDEIIQLYVKVESDDIIRPNMELKGFSRINLQPGETKTVNIPLKHESLFYYDEQLKAYMVSGDDVHIMLGSSAAAIHLDTTIAVTGSKIADSYRQDPFAKFEAEDFDSRSGKIRFKMCSEGTFSVRSITSSSDQYAIYKNMDFDKEAVQFYARIAALADGDSKIQIKLDSIDGPLAGVLNVQTTPSMDVYKDMTCEITGVEGVRDVFIIFHGDIVKTYLNHFTFNDTWIIYPDTVNSVATTAVDYGVEIYPNPANSMVNISYDLPSVSDVSIDIFTTFGQKIFSVNKPKESLGRHTFELDIEKNGLKPGAYIVNIKFDSDSISGKFTVE